MANALLSQFIFKNRLRRFNYGEWDCLQMAGELLEAYGCPNPYAKYRARYSDEFEAYKIIKREAGTLAGCIARGFVPSNDSGIIGAVTTPKSACVLITGRHTAVGLAPMGWMSVPISNVKRRFICPL